MSKDAYWFTHDSNARNDNKMLALRSIYGAEGYGWFFMLIEILREEDGYRLPVNDYTYPGLIAQLRESNTDRVKAFVGDCIKIGLLKSDDKCIWSDSLLNRMAKLDDKREKARNSANIRWEEERRRQAEKEARKQTQLGKPKPEKKPYGTFQNVMLTDEECRKLLERFGELWIAKINELSEALKSRKGYAERYVDHYATILAWARKDNKQGEWKPR